MANDDLTLVDHNQASDEGYVPSVEENPSKAREHPEPKGLVIFKD